VQDQRRAAAADRGAARCVHAASFAERNARSAGDLDALAAALYRLGYAYAKLNKINEARETLQEAVKIQGPIQQPAQELLTKVNSARAKAK
jgi:hypothetical protein